MSYLVLECSGYEPRARLLPCDGFRYSWNTGAPFVEAPREPIELFWDPATEHERKAAFYDYGPVLMRVDLVAALQSLGVDNFDTYEVVIRSKSGRPDQRDYIAVNIIAMSVMDMTRSGIEDESDRRFDVLFQGLVVDEQRAAGQLMFRLAESVRTVILHEKIATGLVSKGVFELMLTEPGNYSR
jgi:hypothetical protein